MQLSHYMHPPDQRRFIRNAHGLQERPHHCIDQVKSAIKLIINSRIIRNCSDHVKAPWTKSYRVMNLSHKSQKIPSVWKTGKIIPILIRNQVKRRTLPNRQAILEKLILPSLKENLHLAGHQHGFRKHKRTTVVGFGSSFLSLLL